MLNNMFFSEALYCDCVSAGFTTIFPSARMMLPAMGTAGELARPTKFPSPFVDRSPSLSSTATMLTGPLLRGSFSQLAGVLGNKRSAVVSSTATGNFTLASRNFLAAMGLGLDLSKASTNRDESLPPYPSSTVASSRPSGYSGVEGRRIATLARMSLEEKSLINSAFSSRCRRSACCVVFACSSFCSWALITSLSAARAGAAPEKGMKARTPAASAAANGLRISSRSSFIESRLVEPE
mmetsp:Transcript_20541/g.33751  ORF Transcript_20541/g.33751 Transcript_20541/m.33751 type:complete len:238 (+) Transcript_20541:519-1232(+)